MTGVNAQLVSESIPDGRHVILFATVSSQVFVLLGGKPFQTLCCSVLPVSPAGFGDNIHWRTLEDAKKEAEARWAAALPVPNPCLRFRWRLTSMVSLSSGSSGTSVHFSCGCFNSGLPVMVIIHKTWCGACKGNRRLKCVRFKCVSCLTWPLQNAEVLLKSNGLLSCHTKVFWGFPNDFLLVFPSVHVKTSFRDPDFYFNVLKSV